MRENVLKNEGESNLDYAFRLYNNKVLYNLSNKEIHELYVKQTGDNRGESTVRCEIMNFIKGFNQGFEKALEDRDNDDILKELEEKRLEIEKEKIRFQDQKREYRNYLRADARFEHLVNTMQSEINKLKYIKPFVTYDIPKEANGNHAVLIVSDWHTGIKESNYWNEISVPILRNRIEELQSKVVEYCKRNNVTTLHLEILGDMVNGLIHLGTRISNEEDVITQTMIASEILANMISCLANNISEIKIYSATGNHGRCVANAKESIDTENFERMIPWYLKSRLSEFKNIEFCENMYDDNIIVYEFLNEKIFSIHGHEDRVGKVINDLSSMLKVFPTEVHMGHYHSYYEKEEHDMSVVVNGTASGVDKYAKHIRKTNKPSQTLLIYNEDGRECTYKIKL